MLSIGVLFRKDKEGGYIRSARICQDILRYSLKIEENKQFSQTELSNWLVNNCDSFEFDPHTPMNNKRYKVQEETSPLFQMLNKLGLINQVGTEPERNGTDILAILQYTDSGRLLAFVIESFNLTYRAQTNTRIYDILLKYHSSNKSSSHQFFLRLLTIYYHQGKLDDLTEVVRNVLEKVTSIPLEDIKDIYGIMKINYFTDIDKASLFLNNWKNAMDSLDPINMDLLLHDIKLESEAKMADCADIGDAASYERHRFEFRGNPKQIALQGKCTKCSMIQNLSYNTSKFLIRNLVDKPLDIKCPKCGDNNCIVIPSL